MNRMCCSVLIVVLGMGISGLIRQRLRNVPCLAMQFPELPLEGSKTCAKTSVFQVFYNVSVGFNGSRKAEYVVFKIRTLSNIEQ